jgi:hypothetical protein
LIPNLQLNRPTGRNAIRAHLFMDRARYVLRRQEMKRINGNQSTQHA